MGKTVRISSARMRRIALAAAATLGVGIAGASVSAPAGAEQQTTVSFSTQGCSTWEVPAGVTSVDISAVGAAGNFLGQASGLGDGVSGTLSNFPSNQVLDVCVDVGGGADGQGAAFDAGGGGGGSGVSLGSDFSQPLIVAGGGGADGGTLGSPSGAGGSAGYPAGSVGQDTNGSTGGGGGSATAVGWGGSPDGSDGAAFSSAGPGSGGTGDGTGNGNDGGGGGGGGGYYGGGGGGTSFSNGGSGGGGGSDLCSNVANVNGCSVSAGEGTGISAGTDPGDAEVTITYFTITTTATTFTAPAPTAAGAPVTLNATVSPVPSSGSVAFSLNGNAITTCTTQPVDPTTGIATCSTTAPTLVGQYPVGAAFSDSSGANTSSGAQGTLNVVPGALSSITLSPSTATITAGGSQTYAVTGYDSFGNSLGDVTGATRLAISPNGSCAGATCTVSTAGTHTVSASDGSVTTQAALDVNAATPSTADLAVKISGPGSPVTTGANVAYTVTVTNNGPGTATGVTTAVALSGLGSVSENVAAKSGSVLGITGVLFTQGTLAPHGTLTYVLSGTVSAKAPGTVDVLAATGSSVHDPNVLNNLTGAATQVIKAPSTMAR
ncbi:MAG TPA: Ig-like domain repeat protein [Acidimicrobiales bacterium]|nr:Ig-like domain repeat protein [Acidimicrobiales bacterium]